MGNNNKFISISEKIRDSNAARIEGRLITFKINYYVFFRNYQELKSILMKMNNDIKFSLNIWSTENRDKLDTLINEISRLLFNFLASAKALVSHTRVLINHWYFDTSFYLEYQEEVKKSFANNELVVFIEDLRNYFLHYALPITRANLKSHKKENGEWEMEHSFTISKQGLLIWKNWKKDSKSFLQKSGEDISIEVLIDEYFIIVENFHKWMLTKLKQIHTEDLKWLEQMRSKARSMMSEKERNELGFSDK